MLLDWLHGDMHHWAIFCCTVASLGLIGAIFCSVGICFGKGALGFLNGSGRQPQVIIVHEGGRYLAQPQKRTWSLGRTFLLFAAIFSGGPMLTLLIMAADYAALGVFAWLGRNWAVPVIALLLALIVGAVWWLVRRERQDSPYAPAHLAVTPTTGPAPVVAAEPVVGWSMPDGVGQWDAR